MMRRIVLIGFALSAIALAGAIKYTYDSAGRLVGASYPDGSVITYTYDKAGNLLSRVVSSGAAPATIAMANSANSASGGIAPGEMANESHVRAAAIYLTSGWPLPTLFLTPLVTANGAPAPSFPGLNQVNFQLPSVLKSGNQPVSPGSNTVLLPIQ